MFLLANAVDDVDMGITHVIRGEDMVNNVPKQLLVIEALGAERRGHHLRPPAAARRRAAAQAVQAVRRRGRREYRDQGLRGRRPGQLPGPAGLGSARRAWRSGPWPRSSSASGSRTSTDRSAFFDVKKLNHINGTYLRELARRRVRRGGRAAGATTSPVLPEALRAARCRSGRTRWARCRAWSTGTSSTSPPIDPAAWAKPSRRDVRRSGARRRHRSLRRGPLGGRRAADRLRRGRRAPGLSSTRPRRRCGWRSPGGRSGRRCSSHSRRWAGSGPCPACGPRGPASEGAHGRARRRAPFSARTGRGTGDRRPGRRATGAVAVGGGARWAGWLVALPILAVALVVTYFSATFVQVWLATRGDDAPPADAIVVLGAAQYNGEPSGALRGSPRPR